MNFLRSSRSQGKHSNRESTDFFNTTTNLSTTSNQTNPSNNFLLQPVASTDNVNTTAKHNEEKVTSDDNYLKHLLPPQQSSISAINKIDFTAYFQQVLFNYINDNDLSTVIFMYLVRFN